MDDESKQQNEPVEDSNFYPLDESAIEIFTEGLKQVERINIEMNGALRLFCKQHKLQGQWTLAENRRELQRMTAPMQVQPEKL